MLLGVKTITLEEIHADPHVLDAPLKAGESVEVSQSGKRVELVPAPAKSEKFIPKKIPKGNHRARLLAMYGADVFSSKVSVQEVFDELRGERS
jgi:hypothetical protein